MPKTMPSDTNTKHFGDRQGDHVRMTETQANTVITIAKHLGVARSTVWNLSLALFAAQYAPLIAQHGLNLDLVEADLRDTFAQARRAVETVRAGKAKQAESLRK